MLGNGLGRGDAGQGPAGAGVALEQPDLVEETGDVTWLAVHCAAFQVRRAIVMPYRRVSRSLRAGADTWFSSSSRLILLSRSAATGTAKPGQVRISARN